MCENFRGFDIRGVPYVYINREIQGMPVLCFDGLYSHQNQQFFEDLLKRKF